MKFLSDVYKENNELDEIFINKYSSDKDMFKKNKLELMVEIAELANETKCFKYWSNKEADKILVNEEYADCIIMTLCLYHYYDLELDDVSFNCKDDINDTFAHLFNLSSSLYFNDDTNIIKEILFNLIHLSTLLKISKEEIVDACLSKIKKDKERLLGDY